MTRLPPVSNRTDTPLPYTSLFRSDGEGREEKASERDGQNGHRQQKADRLKERILLLVLLEGLCGGFRRLIVCARGIGHAAPFVGQPDGVKAGKRIAAVTRRVRVVLKGRGRGGSMEGRRGGKEGGSQCG